MANIFVYSREAIRVKVKKCEGFLQPEYRKFSVDPQITSFEVLQSLLAKAFDIKGDFTVCYRTFDDYGQETFLPLLSDWDLDAAFLSASDPYLCLQVDMKPFEESNDEWDVGPVDVDVVRTPAPESKPQNRLPGLIMNQVERTFNMVQRALNLVEDQQSSVGNHPPRPPLADAEFRKFLDPIGQVVQSRELRTVIYLGGIEPSLRKVVWKHILNVYPDGLSGKERMDYMKKKALEYENLRDCWKNMVQNRQVMGDLAYVTSMVRKDVLRTDRHHRFYAGSDDNQNIASLFNILTTYALNHPTVSYCQGMSDLASPLLVTMGDEAHAYICFCALMRRLQSNFMLDGVTMTLKFQHLAEGLMYYDPEFYAYLKGHQADDLLFCYRWLLLEMKREFAFDDALRMLEVLWSSLPQMLPDRDLPLFERRFCSQSPGSSPPPISPLLKTPRENAYTKVCALRRQSSAASLHSMNNGTVRGIRHAPGTGYRQNQSLDETAMGSHGKHSSRVKQFASLDDTSLQFLSHCPDSKSRSMSPAEALSEPENETATQVNHQISIKAIPPKREISVSTGSLLSKVAEKKVRLKELKEKFAAEGGRSVFSSFDKSSLTDSNKGDSPFNSEKKRVVKNLNEFLNFASFNKNRILQSITPNQDICQMVRESSVISEDSDKTLSGDGDSPKQNIVEDSAQVDNAGTCDLTPQNELGSKGNEIKSLAGNSRTHKSSDDTACDCSSPDDSAEYFPMTTSMTRELRLELENLDRQVFGLKFRHRSFTLEDSEELESPCSESFRSIELKIEAGGAAQKCDCVLSKQESDLPSEDTTTEVAEICSAPVMKPGLILNLDESWHQQSCATEDHRSELYVEKDDSEIKGKSCGLNIKLNQSSQNFSPGPTLGAGEEIFVWENPLQCPTTPDEQADLEYDGTISSSEGDSCFNSSISAGEIFENEGQGVKSVTPIRLLRSAVAVQCRNHSGPSGSPTDDTSDSSDGWGGHTQVKPPRSEFQVAGVRGSGGTKCSSNMLRSKGRGGKEAPQYSTGCGAGSMNSCEEVIEQGSSSMTNSTGSMCTSDSCRQQSSSPPRQLTSSTSVQLPPPHKFGDGNPFLMFLCLTVLLQHRDYIMRSAMDYNEMAMHFDKMVRKHNVTRVLNDARQMYTAYLRHQASINNNTPHTGMDLNV